MFDGFRDVPSQTFVQSVEVMPPDDVAILFDVFGDFGDGSGFLVVNGLVEEGEGVLDFWVREELQRRRVWT